MNRMELLKLAQLGAEARIAQLQSEIAWIRSQFPSSRKTNSGAGESDTPRKRRRMSAAARKRMSAAQKARWAKQRVEAAPPNTVRKKR